MDPLAILNYVRGLGSITRIDCDASAVPVLDAIDHDGAFSIGEFRSRGNIGRFADIRFVSGDEISIACGDQIGFDVIRAHLNGELVCLECVFGSISRGAAMRDDDRHHEADKSLASTAKRKSDLFGSPKRGSPYGNAAVSPVRA